MNRGRRREAIFLCRADYLSFLRIMREGSDAFGVLVAAYCLMPNHYHLLVHTPRGNLSRFMRHVGAVHTQLFNLRHGLDGQLFRGRYKSILVEGNDYLLQLLRYIHRNPSKGGVGEGLSYPWSSHRAYETGKGHDAWLYTSFLLDMLSDDEEEARKRYLDFVHEGKETEADRLLSRQRFPAMMGSKRFTEWARKQFQAKALTPDIPTSRALVPDQASIVEAVCSSLHIPPESLTRSRRGMTNDGRNLCMFLFRTLRGDTLEDIAAFFGLRNYSGASSVIQRVKQRLRNDKDLQAHLEAVKQNIMGQEQT